MFYIIFADLPPQPFTPHFPSLLWLVAAASSVRILHHLTHHIVCNALLQFLCCCCYCCHALLALLFVFHLCFFRGRFFGLLFGTRCCSFASFYLWAHTHTHVHTFQLLLTHTHTRSKSLEAWEFVGPVVGGRPSFQQLNLQHPAELEGVHPKRGMLTLTTACIDRRYCSNSLTVDGIVSITFFFVLTMKIKCFIKFCSSSNSGCTNPDTDDKPLSHLVLTPHCRSSRPPPAQESVEGRAGLLWLFSNWIHFPDEEVVVVG